MRFVILFNLFILSILIFSTLHVEGYNTDNTLTSLLYEDSNIKNNINNNEKALVFKIGQESISKSKSINGGSYLYIETLLETSDFLSFGTKYSFDLFPNSFKDNLFSITSKFTFNFYAKKEFSAYLSPGYLLNTDFKDKSAHYIGMKFCLINSGRYEKQYLLELLPFSFYYDLKNKDWTFSFEFFSIGFRF